MFGEGINLFGDGQIPRGDAVGLEEGDLFVVGAARDLAGDELVEFMNGVPLLRLLLKRNDKVAGFLFGLLNRIHEYDGGAGNGGVVEFALMGVIRSDGVDVQTRTVSSFRAAAMASSCVFAWPPVPRMAAVRAFWRARYFVATPEAAPVRCWPMKSASIRARSAPVEIS